MFCLEIAALRRPVVIQVGVPFAQFTDIRVKVLKEHFEKIKKGQGDKWYKIEAIRAVNQAIGRVLHGTSSMTTGVIILLDERFSLVQISSHFSLHGCSRMSRQPLTGKKCCPRSYPFIRMEDAQREQEEENETLPQATYVPVEDRSPSTKRQREDVEIPQDWNDRRKDFE